MNDPEQELERLSDVLVPYLCERTGLQSAQIEAVLDAIELFWENQPNVGCIMFVNGVPVIEDNDEEPRG